MQYMPTSLVLMVQDHHVRPTGHGVVVVIAVGDIPRVSMRPVTLLLGLALLVRPLPCMRLHHQQPTDSQPSRPRVLLQTQKCSSTKPASLCRRRTQQPRRLRRIASRQTLRPRRHRRQTSRACPGSGSSAITCAERCFQAGRACTTSRSRSATRDTRAAWCLH